MEFGAGQSLQEALGGKAEVVAREGSHLHQSLSSILPNLNHTLLQSTMHTPITMQRGMPLMEAMGGDGVALDVAGRRGSLMNTMLRAGSVDASTVLHQNMNEGVTRTTPSSTKSFSR